MAASLEAQGIPTLNEILSCHGLQREDVDIQCPQWIRLEMSVKMNDWKVVGHYLGIPDETLVAIQVDNNTEDE
ncbi:MAG: hypothetical protein MJE68_13365 [Proteobacteria bacterium]|nr:hypothetical protein [Pseudomonadota bacterium]